MKLACFFQKPAQSRCASWALLFLRVVAGSAMAMHGWGKIQAPFNWMGDGAPVPGFLQFLAAFSEFAGGIAWVIGLLTPLASLGIVITMIVAAAMHLVVRHDPFVSATGGPSAELASIYLAIAAVLMSVGPGCVSLDMKVFGYKK